MSLETVEREVDTLGATVRQLNATLTSLVTYVSENIPSKRDMDRLRTEIVLMRETLPAPTIGNINTDDLRKMIEVKPTLDNLIAIVTNFDTFRTDTGKTLTQMTNQLNAIQIQLSRLLRES